MLLSADYLEVQRSVTLKTQPNRDAEVRETLAVGTRLELLQDQQENGYYRVHEPQTGSDGWVYRTFVRRFHGRVSSGASTGSGSSTTAGTGTWFRFDRDFVTTRFATDLAFSSLTFDTQWKASSKHRASCGGEDGEIHVGAYENVIDFAAAEQPFARVADGQTVAWGLVAEPPNTRQADSDAFSHLENSRVTFTGYVRVWNEGHFVGETSPKPNGSSNPNHIVELHPVWHLQSTDDQYEEYDFAKTAPMAGFSGYGMSKARPMLQKIDSGAWPRAYADSGSVYVSLSRESNFYQLPVRIQDVQTVGEGLVIRADVCDALGCPGNQFLFRNLRIVARAASLDTNSTFQVGDAVELVGIFSVHLGRALSSAQSATTRAQAVPVTQALEFFAFSKAGQPAVRNSNCDPEQ